METSLKKSSTSKVVSVSLLTKPAEMQETHWYLRPNESHPYFLFIVSVPGQFSHEFITMSATLIHLTGRHWDQLHSVCLILYLVKTVMNRTPNSKMRSAWNINLIQWEAECGWRWNWSCRQRQIRKDSVCFVLLPIYSTGVEERSKSLTGALHSWHACEIVLQWPKG